MRRVVFLVIAGMGAFSSVSRAQDTAAKLTGYEEPNLTAKIFNMSQVSIPEDERKNLATNLGTYVRNARPITPEQNQINSKCVALALNLDPENKTAFLANYYLKDGKEPPVVKSGQKTEEIWNNLLTIAQKAYDSKVAANQQVAANLAELAIKIIPENENAIFLSEMIRKQGIAASWTAVAQSGSANKADSAKSGEASQEKARLIPKKGKEAPDDPEGRVVIQRGLREGFADVPREFKLKQQTIKGLDVFVLAPDKFAGGVVDFIGTIAPSHNPGSETTSHFTSSHVGPMMKQGLEEAVKAVRQRYPIWGRGQFANITFPDQYQHRDGPSGSVACAILLLSMLDGFECCQDGAITGDITANWGVNSVGGVPGKIRGAMKQNLKLAVIPKNSVGQVQDWLLMEPVYYDPLTKIQLFAVDTLEDAIEIMRKDRSEDLAGSIKKMEEIQTGLARHRYEPKSGDARYRAKLEDILAKAPNMLSAKLLLDIENGDNPQKLSANASADRLLSIVDPFWQWAKKNDNKRGEFSLSAFHFSDEVYSQATRDLNDIQFKLDARASEFSDKVKNLIEKWKDLDATLQMTPFMTATQQQKQNCVEKWKEANNALFETYNSIQMLLSDPKYIEDMRN